MTTSSSAAPTVGAAAPEAETGDTAVPVLSITGKVLIKAVLIGGGLCAGGFLGLVVGLWSGLIAFRC